MPISFGEVPIPRRRLPSAAALLNTAENKAPWPE